MKRFTCVLLFLLTAVATASPQSFEGLITFKISGQGHSAQLKYYSKGEDIRMESLAEGGDMIVIMNLKSRIMRMLIPKNKAYMEMDLEKLSSPSDEARNDVDFEKTGKTEVILGYPCEQILVKQENNSAEMWVTTGLGKFLQANVNPRTQSPAMRKLERELIEKGYFPLRMIARHGDGQEETRMDVTSIEKKSLSRDMFTIPSGFKKMEMPQRMY